MSASIANDKIRGVRNGGSPQPTTVSSSRSIGGTSLSCVALTNWFTGTPVDLITYKKKSDGSIDKTTLCIWEGIVSGSTIGSLTLMSGTDAGNDAGDYVECGNTDAWAQGLYDGITAEHKTTGKHGAVTADSVTINSGGSLDMSNATTVTYKSGSVGTSALAGGVGNFGAWATFTPTFNLVGGGSWGNATFAGRSNQVGKTVRFWAKFTLGSTTNFTGLTGITLNLPVTASSSCPMPSRIGDTFMTNFYNGGVVISSTTVANIYVFNTTGTYLSPGEMTATVPHTWANTYFCVVSGEYEAA